jgi:CelD/BcsL family acetyltransferase involved in cellulose biosynthesis
MAILESEQIFGLTNFETSWDYLLSKSLDSNPFLTYEWLTAWSKHFGQGRELKLFTAGTNGRVSLAIPVSYSTKRSAFGSTYCEVKFIGAPHSDYQTFLVTNLQEANKSLNHLFESIIEDSGTNNIEFTDVPEDSATAILLQNIKAEGFKVSSSVFDSCPFVPLPNNFEIFQQNLGSNMRRNLKVWEKQAKKEYQIKFIRYDEIGDLKEAVNIFFDLHQKRQIAKGESGVFAHNITRDLSYGYS